MNQYLEIFKTVRQKLEWLGYVDDEVSDNYASIFMKLSPNPFTFQQLMVDYLSEFNVKSLDFIEMEYVTNGVRVRRQGDSLIVTDVTEDTRFVVGDRIIKLSGDAVSDLAERYKKLLFFETESREDWHPILRKQTDVTLMRGDEEYTFDLLTFPASASEVLTHPDYEEWIIYHLSDLQSLLVEDTNQQLVIDLRNSFGLVSEERLQWMAERIRVLDPIILVDALTKGSAEHFVDMLSHNNVWGRETYGQAEPLHHDIIDGYYLIYSESKDKTVLPGNMVELRESSYISDDIKQAALRRI